MAKFYAIEHRYGVNTINDKGDHIGALHVFDSRTERDAWVKADRWDGNYHRSSATLSDRRDRRFIRSAMRERSFWNADDRERGHAL